jgi:predicted  nucleic acid-binding Zn-ribbon protein
MNKTRVDDLLIEMISPKIKEIEEKFSRGDGLTQDDINTLLLKSQYNHINHLDSKLNEVTASVQALELKFAGLETKFAGLETKFAGLETKFEQSMVKMQAELISTIKWYIGGTGIVLVMFKALDMFVA